MSDQRAVDFSSSRPDPAELVANGIVGALTYDKPFIAGDPPTGMPADYLAALQAAGLVLAGIHEEDGWEATKGYQRGVQAAQRADASFAPGTLVYYCLLDAPHGQAAPYLDQIAEFTRGAGDTTREPVIGGYGPINALRAGQRGSAKLQRLWGVETWHPDTARTGDPARNVETWRAEGVQLLQMANVASPVAGTDLDLIFDPAWASIGSAPTPTPEVRFDMAIILHGPNGSGFHYFDGLASRYFGEGDPEMAKLTGNGVQILEGSTQEDIDRIYARLNAGTTPRPITLDGTVKIGGKAHLTGKIG